tara:strand:+ start:847 stop:1161 length:315 start_codon:yes stop_codon:yes gene_type:complete
MTRQELENQLCRNNNVYNSDIKELEIITTGTKPSWKNCEGRNTISFRASGLNPEKPASGWVEIFASETAYAETDNGRDVTKEVYITLRLDAAKQLKAMLNELNI